MPPIGAINEVSRIVSAASLRFALMRGESVLQFDSELLIRGILQSLNDFSWEEPKIYSCGRCLGEPTEKILETLKPN